MNIIMIIKDPTYLMSIFIFKKQTNKRHKYHYMIMIATLVIMTIIIFAGNIC